MKKIIVWGTGNNARQMMKDHCFDGAELVCFVDTYRKIDSFEGFPVIVPDQIQGKKYDWLIISMTKPEEVYEKCKALKIDDSKIIIVYNTIMKGHQYHFQDTDAVREQLPKLGEVIDSVREIYDQCAPVRRCHLDYESEFDPDIRTYYNDREYIRVRTIGLAADEVKQIKGDWDVAELGVFQGSTSRLISLLFPERKIYMFDTFESFDRVEADKEIESGYCDDSFVDTFKNTSLERVKEIMPYKDKYVIRKGLFPETAEGLEDNRYGFVSLDVDLEESTYAGLTYFVPRMIEGGYIFLHDYNHVKLKGVKNAVKRYEKDNDMRFRKVPICDSDGTLVLSF